MSASPLRLKTPLSIALLYSPPHEGRPGDASASAPFAQAAAAAALAPDEAEAILRRASIPPKLPPESSAFLESLVRSPDARLRALAADYPALSAPALHALAADRAHRVKEALASGGALFAQTGRALCRSEALELLLALSAGDASLAAAALSGGVFALKDRDSAPEDAAERQRLLLDFIASLAQAPLFADPDLQEEAAAALYAAASLRPTLRRPLGRMRWRPGWLHAGRGAEDSKTQALLQALAAGGAPFGDVEPEERLALSAVLERRTSEDPAADGADAFFLCFAAPLPFMVKKHGGELCECREPASLRAALGLAPDAPVAPLDPAAGPSLLLLPTLGRWPLSVDEAAAAADLLPYEGTDRIVEALASHPAERVRAAAASRLALPKAAIARLKGDRAQSVREAIAGNAAFLDELESGEILAVLEKDPELIEHAADFSDSERLARLLARAFADDADPTVHAALQALAEAEDAQDRSPRSAMRRRFGLRRR